VFVVGTLLLVTGCSSVRKFESQKWLAGDYSSRGPMAEDIVNTRVLIGLNKTDVEKLLGQPNHKSSYSEGDAYAYKARTSNLRCYWLWECGLSVAFDKSTGRVTSTLIYD
jgi:outer membrane protein assembly factor BamE (lipoprotein component of BamABCDE complex)